MTSILAVVNQKGGVGKTTTAINIASFLAIGGSRVLLVDMDPQGNASSGIGIERKVNRKTVYDVLIHEVPIREAIAENVLPNLSVLPANIDLAGAEIEMINRLSRETILTEALSTVQGNYDFVFIDVPPSLGLLTLNALVAANALIIPIQAEYYALEGIGHLMKTVEIVRKRLNPNLEIALVLMTMVDVRYRLAQQVIEEVKLYFGDKVSKNLITRNVKLSEAPSHGLPISLYDPRSKGAQLYKQIAEEVRKYAEKSTR